MVEWLFSVLLAQLRQLDLPPVRSVTVSDLYFLRGDLAPADLQRLARELLVDPITESYRCRPADGDPDTADSVVEGGYVEQVPEVRDLVDVLTQAEIPAVGPKKEYTKIESDRAFTNRMLERIDVKLEWRVFDPGPDATEQERKKIAGEAKRYVRDVGYQVVVKAGGLHVVAGGNSLEGARTLAYRNVERLAFLDHRNQDENVLRYRKTIASV